MLLIQSFLYGFFNTFDIFLMYVCFEAILPILFLTMIIAGERLSSIKAALLMFGYTIALSMPFLCAIAYVFNIVGTTNLEILDNFEFSPMQQFCIYLMIYITTCVKIPTWPAHDWLPYAHVEAHSCVSVLLAAIILKMGGYFTVRILQPVCPDTHSLVAPFTNLLNYFTVIYTTAVLLCESDGKEMIAYSSISHMNITQPNLTEQEMLLLLGGIGMMFAHSIISSGLFTSFGVLYERFQQRDEFYYGGIKKVNVIFAIFFLIFTISNFSFPFTISFWPELILLLGLIETSISDTLLSLCTSIFLAACSVSFYINLFLGLQSGYIMAFAILHTYEIYSLSITTFIDIWFGLNPMIYFRYIEQVIPILCIT